MSIPAPADLYAAPLSIGLLKQSNYFRDNCKDVQLVYIHEKSRGGTLKAAHKFILLYSDIHALVLSAAAETPSGNVYQVFDSFPFADPDLLRFASEHFSVERAALARPRVQRDEFSCVGYCVCFIFLRREENLCYELALNKLRKWELSKVRQLATRILMLL